MSARVLVVDDLLPNVKLLEAKLSREYYEVITAFNGKDAIDKARKLSPDIILLDVMMPQMDGFETCRVLRSDPELSHIPVIMVTALSEKEDRIRGLEAGADDFLTKPVADTPLFARVRSLIRLKVMMDELRLRGVTNVKLGMDENEFSLGKISDAKILLVDDDNVQAGQLIEKLSHINKNIKLISNPSDAIDIANKDEFDLAIISTQLADADGLRICSQLRSNEQTRNMSILIVTEEGDSESMLKGMEIGVNDYIQTPVDTNELVARAKTLIRRKKYQDALRTNFKTSISLAVTDGLTGLHNRRFMDTHIEQLVKEAHDYSKSLSVLMLDIDHFKQVNDTFGHNVGDEVIKEFSERILRSVRPSDLAVRYGGEEFVIILPGAPLEDAKAVAERLRKNIEKVPFTVSTEDGILSKTVSIGIAKIKPNETAEQILKRADEALYKAKNGGRNQCVVSED